MGRAENWMAHEKYENVDGREMNDGYVQLPLIE